MSPLTFPRALAVAVLLAASPAAAQHTGERFLIAETVAPDPQGDVLEVAAATGQFTHFIEAVEAAGLAETLRGAGPFTLFAPTDEAFRRADAREWERLLAPERREELAAIIAYHIAPGRITSLGAEERVQPIETQAGYRLTIDGRDGLRVNDHLVVMPDIEASNGVIQGVNEVLTPPVLVASR